MKRYAVGLGEALWDILPEGRKPGGAPANFAYHAGQYGIDSMAVSALGCDRLGDETIQVLKDKGLSYLMPRVPYPTGTVQVTLDGGGVPSYDIRENVAWDNIPFSDEIRAIARSCRAVCFGTLAQRGAVSRHTVQAFLDNVPNDCLRIFDINLRQNFYSTEIINESLKRCDILKINDEELAQTAPMLGCRSNSTDDRCLFLLSKYHLDMLVLTCGVNGSYVFTPGHVSFLPTPQVAVADTVGAGDSFTGCFCAAILRGLSVQEAHRAAVEVSAYVCTQNGAMPPVPPSLRERVMR